MREIKFRVWQKYHKQMLEVLDIGFKDGKVNSAKVKYPEDTIPSVVTYKKNDKKFWLDDDCIKLMQYTGLKDKNGKEIYEGDIVKYENGCIAQIVWDNEEYHAFLCLFKCSYLLLYGHDNFEVIGNIYENPELLKGR